MNFEKLQNITTPIEAENVLEREEKLMDKIKEISLVYAISRWEKVKQEIPDYKLSEALKFYSPTENFILRPIFDLGNFDFRKNKEKMDQLLSVFYGQVDALSENGEVSSEKILDLIIEHQKNIITSFDLENLPKEGEKENNDKTKVVQFNNFTHLDNEANGKFAPLMEEGFDKNDEFIEVHFKDFYQSEQASLTPDLIRQDLGLIAEKIIKEKPETAAIIGKSWLLDTAVASNLGFKVLKNNDIKSNDFSTWFQFIDKDGEINKKRIDALMKNGELPFKSVIAYIKTEDFLKRYLPSELRGKIILKELDQEKKEEIDELFKNDSSLKELWRSAVMTDNFDSFINNKLSRRIFDFIDETDKEKVLTYYQKMFDEKIVDDFSKYRDEEVDAAFNKMRENIKGYIYSKDKEITID